METITLEDAMEALGLEPDQLLKYEVTGDSVLLVTFKDQETEILWRPGAEPTMRPRQNRVLHLPVDSKEKSGKKKG